MVKGSEEAWVRKSLLLGGEEQEEIRHLMINKHKGKRQELKEANTSGTLTST